MKRPGNILPRPAAPWVGVTLLILALGALLRLTVYLQGRSLIMDEANLARNVVEKPYADLWGSLDYQQVSPPLFTLATKALADGFGVNEWALRALPLLGGVAALLLLAGIAARLIEARPIRWYLLLLFGFSALAVRYSSELKPYATDAAIALAFVYAALRCRGPRPALAWALLGALAIWCSLPVVFVLAAIGSAWLGQAWRRPAPKRSLLRLAAVGAAWMLSFGIYFASVLHDEASSAHLQAYHARYFFTLLPTSPEALAQDRDLLLGLFRSATDKTAVPIAWGILTFLLGSVYAVRKKRFAAALLLLPLLGCLGASHFHWYSLIPRLTLFLIPLLLLLMGMGTAWAWARAGRPLRAAMLLLMGITLINSQGYRYFWERLELEDSRSVLAYLAEHRREAEPLYVHWDGVPAFVFYNQQHDRAWGFGNYYLAHWSDQPAEVLPARLDSLGAEAFWLFFSHTFPAERVAAGRRSAAALGTETDRFVRVEASTYRFRVDRGRTSRPSGRRR